MSSASLNINFLPSSFQGCIAEQTITHTCSPNHANETDPDAVDGRHGYDKCVSLSNTWPRKKLRQQQQHAHVASVFAEGQRSEEEPHPPAPHNGYGCSDDPHRLSCQHAMYGGDGCGLNSSQVPPCTCYVNSCSTSSSSPTVTRSNHADQTVSVSAQTNGVPVTRVSKSMGSMQILPPGE